MSSVDTTGTTSAPAGYVTSTGPLTTTTWCPASTAASASAAPIRPLEALRQVPHRVEVLPRRAGGDEDAGHGMENVE